MDKNLNTNIEQSNLMFFVATPEVFAEYLGENTPILTMLQSGKGFAHMCHCRDMASRYSGDNRVLAFGHEALIEYLKYVDDYIGSDTL